jgi:CHASE3 domain sensor protein
MFFSVIFVISLIMTVAACWQFSAIIQKIDQAQSAENAAHALMVTLLNAETGQRGYIITGDIGYLAPYHEALTHIETNMQILTDAALPVGEIEHVSTTNELITRKLQELQYTIDVRNNAGLQAASGEVLKHLGKNLMDSIRVSLDSIQLKAVTVYITNEHMAQRYGQAALFGMVVTLVAGCLITIHR